jgi:hypothetical protein
MTDTEAETLLTKNEIEDVQTLIKEIIAEVLKEIAEKDYLISEIHGEYWNEVKRDGSYKKRFKRSAQLEKIKHLMWVKTKTDNNELYRIIAR